MRVTEEIDLAELTPGARRILDAASTLFYERGIHAVGVESIAAAAGVTKRTLYDRFESKDRLVTAYLRRRHDTWWARFERRLSHAARPRVLALFDAYAEELVPAQRGCAFLNAAGELPADHPGIEVVRAHKRSVRARLRTLLAEEALEGDAAEAVGDHLFLLLEGALAHRGIEEAPPRLAQRARDLAREVIARSSSGSMR